MTKVTRYIFDTTAYSELLRGTAAIAALLSTGTEICLPNVVIAELRYGFELGSRKLDNEKLLARFLASNQVRVLLPDNATTDYFVAISLYARKKGIQLSTHDLWIAALTQQWDGELVSLDKDFRHLDYPGVRLWK